MEQNWCNHCGSSRHQPERCNILMKLQALESGEMSLDEAFPNQIVMDEPQDLIDGVSKLRFRMLTDENPD